MRSQAISAVAASEGWALGRTIGRGATATVSLGTASGSGHLFAIKSSPVSRSALLRREQSILSSLSSPHIISCLGFSVSDESYHLFLELAGGGALSDLAGRLDEPKIRTFTRQILLALCYLHSVGFAHCDVKSRNVLLCSDDCVKLADFGCARKIEGGRETVMGTPAFMAPEVVRGEEQGAAGDLWSLGCTVVEMATGKSPWPEATSPAAAIHRITLSSDTPAVPEWISDKGKDFVSKCLRRDPKERWTAKELLRHPFMTEAEEEEEEDESLDQACSTSKPNKWVSPKSTLESCFWESEAEEDEEDGYKEVTAERIRQLESPPANWSWDDSWLAVRGRSDESDEIGTPEFNREGSGSGRNFSNESDGWESVISIRDSMDEEEEEEEVLVTTCFTIKEAAYDVKRSCNSYVGIMKEFQIFL